ncbi:MAG TPA: NAD-dependent epimerase/dehydratase family protein [Pyrinomonadaceae bacterium]|nr:NAD-dependent epimerase/dehydratase family protein [Pyrinomonadaceae bacterium]
MRVLVTGGSGYLGTHIRRFFEADDLSRRSGLDILNLQDTQMAADYDVVIHLAASMDKSHENAEEVFLTNVEGTVNLLRVMKEDSIFIFASTKDVYGRFADNFREVPETCPTLYSGQSPLEWSKLVAEHYVDYYSHQRRFRSCIFRLSTVYAPATEGNTPGFVGHYADCLDQGKPIRLPGAGRPVRDLLHVADLSRACKAFIDSVIRHGTYNLGGGPKNAASLSNLVELLETASGFQAVLGSPLPDPVPFNYVSDIGRVTQELDWSPEIDNETGLRTLFASNAESEAAGQ